MTGVPDDLRTPPLDDDTRTALLGALEPLGPVTGLTQLAGGMFATSVRVDLADGRRVVAKTAPAQEDSLLRYEHDLIRTEALVYAEAADDPALLMPRPLLTDFSREHLPGDLVVASWAEGVRADSEPDLARATAAVRNPGVGRMMAALHRHTGASYGYPSGPESLRGGTWPDTLTAMIEAVLADADDWAVPVPADRVRTALTRYREDLATVGRPALVHADLWPGNQFIDPHTGALTAVIDPERAFWGDPLFDLIGCDPFRPEVDPNLVAGYREAGGDLALDRPEIRRRLAFCRVYLALIMRVEVRPRRYQGDWLPGYLVQIEDMLAAGLADLD